MARADGEGESELERLTAPIAKLLELRRSQPSTNKKPDASTVPDIVAAGRRALERRRSTLRGKLRPEGDSDGQELSQLAVEDVRFVPLANVFVDKEFKDARIHDDPLHKGWHGNEGQYISDLVETMKSEGLKIPIVVAQKTVKGKEVFLLRAGGRRRKAALALGWTEIPAIVLPDLKLDRRGAFEYEKTQQWYNILENTARKNLSTYELAVSARHMRNEYGVNATDFARKTGYSPSYVANLIGCIDRLPEHLTEQWRDGALLSLEQWIGLSYLEHDEAVKTFRRMVGMSAKDRLSSNLKKRRRPLLPPRWYNRMDKLRIGIEGSELPPATRKLVLDAIWYCMGVKDDVPGVYEPGKHRKYEAKARLRAELALPTLPDPGESKEMPPPMDEEDA